jgi:sigma-B regulation protein RsbU (phosphoserine phosphatase)
MDRIHDELNLAASVQQEMLPRGMPEIAGLECGFLFRPVGYVSGDIYDVTPLDDRHLGFFVADAVGHGVPAALMTMVISRALRLVRTEDGHAVAPGEVLTRLNADLVRGRKHTSRFGTAVYGVIDTSTMRVRISGAGHPYPVVVRRGGATVRMPLSGALLGVFPDEQYTDVSFDLGPDETLLLFSDGLETAFANPLLTDRPGRRTGSDAHLKELSRLRWPDSRRGVSLADAMGSLSGLLDSQAGSLHQADDITIVALRRVGAALGGLLDCAAAGARDAA